MPQYLSNWEQYLEHAINQNRESTEGCSKWIVRKKIRQFREKDWSQRAEHIQDPNGTGPGVGRSKRPLSAYYTNANVQWKPLISR